MNNPNFGDSYRRFANGNSSSKSSSTSRNKGTGNSKSIIDNPFFGDDSYRTPPLGLNPTFDRQTSADDPNFSNRRVKRPDIGTNNYNNNIGNSLRNSNYSLGQANSNDDNEGSIGNLYEWNEKGDLVNRTRADIAIAA